MEQDQDYQNDSLEDINTSHYQPTEHN